MKKEGEDLGVVVASGTFDRESVGGDRVGEQVGYDLRSAYEGGELEGGVAVGKRGLAEGGVCLEVSCSGGEVERTEQRGEMGVGGGRCEWHVCSVVEYRVMWGREGGAGRNSGEEGERGVQCASSLCRSRRKKDWTMGGSGGL